MASYTMQLREYIESFSDENVSPREAIKIGREKLFDFDYPIFDPDYKNVFETNFIRNFYMREIGFESEGLFKFQLETWLMINMPYFNKLFESELIKFNPLESYSLKTTYQKKNDVKQNEDRKRLQNDEKTVNQNDTSKNQLNQTEINTQNDLNTVSQNDRITKNQSENKDRTQNDETTNSHDGNTVTDGTSSINENVSRETTSETESQGESNVDRLNKTSSTDTDDNFNRFITADTPDTRLNLTLKDGEGALLYASRIDENNVNNKKTTKGENDETQKQTNDETSLTTNNETADTVNDGTTHTDTTTKTDDVGKLTSKIGERNNIESTDILTSDVTNDTTTRESNQKNHVIDNTLNSNVNDKLKSDVNDTSTSTINDLEDYLEEKVGSIGVKTYSEMIIEYRESLIRIEKQIFKEMNELFMLVY